MIKSNKKLIYIFLSLLIATFLIKITHYNKKKVEISQNTNSVSMVCKDRNTEKNYFVFWGYLKNKDLDIEIRIPCNLNKLIISGSVEQILEENTLKDAHIIIDSVSVENDYNFDGYKDLTLWGPMDTTGEEVEAYFIFDPINKIFTYNKDLNKINNLSISGKMLVSSSLLYIDLEQDITQYSFYVWKDGMPTINHSIVVAFDNKNSIKIWESHTILLDGINGARDKLRDVLSLNGNENVLLKSINPDGYRFSIISNDDNTQKNEYYLVNFNNGTVVKEEN